MKSIEVRATILGLLGVVGAACGDVQNSAETFEKTRQAVGNGALTTQHKYTVALTETGAQIPFCSAVLISQAWVATAAHCLLGSEKTCFPISGAEQISDRRFRPFDVVLNDNVTESDPTPFHPVGHPEENPASLRFRKVEALAFLDDTIDGCSAADTMADVALVRLEHRVPKGVANRVETAGLMGPRCQTEGDFRGRLVGYGLMEWNIAQLFDSFFDIGRPVATRRNTRDSDGWSRNALGIGDVPDTIALYENLWLIPLLPTGTTAGWYNGAIFGDSGGAFLKGSKLCGVNSRWFPTTTGFPFFLPAVVSQAAALDGDQIVQGIEERLIDYRGVLVGECPSGSLPGVGADQDSDDDYLPDNCDPCPLLRDETYRRTGQLGPEFQTDTDGDGVPDICDNCLSRPNPRVVVAGVAVQPDIDADGLGDRCDSCPNSSAVSTLGYPELRSDLVFCNTNDDCPGTDNFCRTAIVVDDPPQVFPGVCALPRDRDGDGIADNCDNCPATRNADQADTDADGAGDACDNCAGLHEGGPDPRDTLSPGGCAFVPGNPEISNAPCMSLHPDGVCVPPHPIGGDIRFISEPRCTHGLDPDDDGLANFCDGCPNIANPLEFGISQPNCNRESELANGIPYPGIPDACDPTPCAEVMGASTEASSFADMSYNPRILPEGVPGAFDYEGPPMATVGGRFCECLVEEPAPGGLTVRRARTPLECLNSGDCPFGNAMDVYDSLTPPLGFVPVTLRRNASSPPTPDSEFTELRFGPAIGHDTPPGGDLVNNSTFRFQWDVSTLPTETFPELGRTGTDGVMGVYWSHVKEVPELRFPGTTVPVAPSVYRNLSNNYTSGFFGSVGADPPFTNDPITVPTACCNRLVCGGPCPSCDPFGSGWLGFRDPSQPGNVDTWITQPGGFVDLSPRLPPSVRVGLNDPGLRWEFLAEQLTQARSDRVFGVGFRPDTLEVVSAVAGSLAAPSLAQPYRQTPFTTPVLAVFGSEGLRINDRVEVRVPDGSMATVAAAAGEANIGADAKVGDLSSGGTVVLRNRAQVFGTLRSTGAIDESIDATVQGIEVPGAELALPDLASLSLEFPPAFEGDIDLQPDQTLSLAPGSYGTVSLKSGTVTTLQSGRYFFRSLSLELDSVVRFDSAEGPVYLYVEESFTYRGALVDEQGRHDQLFVGYFGTGTAAIDRPFSGTLVTPNGAINLASVDPAGPGHRGSFFGKEVEVHQGSIVWHYPFAHPWDLGAIEPQVAARRFGPAPRTDYGAVMSATEQSLFVIGGTLEDGTPAHDIWQHALSADATAGGRWVRLAVEGTLPETVLAATYRAEDRGLYVLDRIDGNLARLLRYGLATGISTVLASFPLDGGFTRFELGNAPDGGLSLFTSQPGEGATHCVATFVPSGGSIGSIAGLLGAGELGGGSCNTPAGLVLGLSDPAHPTRLSLSATLASELSFTSGFDINQCL